MSTLRMGRRAARGPAPRTRGRAAPPSRYGGARRSAPPSRQGGARSTVPARPRPVAPGRGLARRRAALQARRLGPAYGVARHRNPRLRHPHYHVVRRLRGPGRQRILIRPDYYPYRDDVGAAPAAGRRNGLLPHLPSLDRGGGRYRRWLHDALRAAARHGGLPVRRVGRLLASLDVGWERAERALIRAAGLGPPPGLSPEPTPGAFYAIRPGDRLLALASAAYPDTDPLAGARRINGHRFNRRLWRSPRGRAARYFPEGIIAFTPRFRAPEEQGLSPGREPRDGDSYAVIYIPRPGW